MELKEFITDVLQQINDGVVDAQKRGVFVNPKKIYNKTEALYNYVVDGVNDQERLQTVYFEVGLTKEEGSGGGKFGVSFGGVSLGVDSGGKASNSAVTRVRFSIPILLPVYKDYTKD